MGVLLYHRNGETFRTLYPERRGKTAESDYMKQITQKQFIDTLKDVMQTKDLNVVINRLSSALFIMSDYYTNKGYDSLAEDATNGADALYNLLDNIGYYDDCKAVRRKAGV